MNQLPASVLAHRKNMLDEHPAPPPEPTKEVVIQISDIQKLKYDFDDVLITPAVQSSIESRYSNDVNPYYFNTTLPLFTAPMDTVVDVKSSEHFRKHRINIVFPRTEKNKNIAHAFNSVGFDELKEMIPKMTPNDGKIYLLLDVANGHMNKVIRYCKLAKERNPNLTIMAGNVANPETYKVYCESGVIEYARVGIGNGNGCLTTQQTGVGYPMASLIAECNEIKRSYKDKKPCKIVADGGMKDYSDIIRALALGADYVMIGSMFNKAFESAAPIYWRGIKLNDKWAKKFYEWGFQLKKEFRGMSTKKAQQALGSKKLKTSEGVIRQRNVEYTLEKWVENFESYLRTAMSYTNCKTLDTFIGKVNYTIITQNSHKRYNK